MIGEEERDVAMRAMAGLTGGCYRGDFCGAIAGATQVIGCLFAGASKDEMEDAPLSLTVRNLYDRLKKIAVKNTATPVVRPFQDVIGMIRKM